MSKKPLCYPKLAVADNVYDLAIERMRYVYDLFDTVAVSFSGGKDSTCALHVALQVARERGRLPLRVFFFDEEAIPYEVEHYVRRVAAWPDIDLQWYCVPLEHTNACSGESAHWITWNPDEQHLWVRPMPPEAITQVEGYDPTKGVLGIPAISAGQFNPARDGRSAIVLGIRAAESLTRYKAVSRRGTENYIVQETQASSWGGSKNSMGNTYKVYPIYDWQTSDVWTAPQMFGWDYCEAYDLMEMAGITHHAQRIAPPFGTQPSRQLGTFRACFPDIWEKIQFRVPGANTAALYANTELYAVGKVEKPNGITWEKWIVQLLEEVPEPEMRQALSDAVRGHLALYVEKAGDTPILPKAAHPRYGMTWEILAKIVIRRDTKARMRPDMYVIPDKKEKEFTNAMRRWEAARIEYEAGEGRF